MLPASGFPVPSVFVAFLSGLNDLCADGDKGTNFLYKRLPDFLGALHGLRDVALEVIAHELC